MKKNSDITKHKLYDRLLKEFHPTLNEALKLSDFSYGSNKKLWWQCDVADDHVWEAKINKRTNGRNCPCCVGKKVVKSNCLATTHPEIAKEWHPTKNGELTPQDVTIGSRKKIWWQCSIACDHVWDALIVERKDGNNCPLCSGHRVVLSNCLATTHPEIAKEWHPTKNGKLTPNDVIAGSNKKIWWKCSKANDHEWKAMINKRTSGRNCPCCSNRKLVLSNCLATTHPDLTKEWHPIKNGELTPYDVVAGYSKKVWWKCDKSDKHVWKISPHGRTSKKGTNCPFCNESHGEKSISKILSKLSINYEQQKKFDGCIYKNKLPFDFYLPNYNVLIEYDGEQHFKPIKWFGGQSKFEYTQMTDSIKNKFAIENDIQLLRISYIDFNNIEDIIIEYISKLEC